MSSFLVSANETLLELLVSRRLALALPVLAVPVVGFQAAMTTILPLLPTRSILLNPQTRGGDQDFGQELR